MSRRLQLFHSLLSVVGLYIEPSCRRSTYFLLMTVVVQDYTSYSIWCYCYCKSVTALLMPFAIWFLFWLHVKILLWELPGHTYHLAEKMLHTISLVTMCIVKKQHYNPEHSGRIIHWTRMKLPLGSKLVMYTYKSIHNNSLWYPCGKIDNSRGWVTSAAA